MTDRQAFDAILAALSFDLDIDDHAPTRAAWRSAIARADTLGEPGLARLIRRSFDLLEDRRIEALAARDYPGYRHHLA